MYNRENLAELLTKADVNNLTNLAELRVLLRSCLNVAVDKQGNIIDRTRLDESYPTIKDLASKSKQLYIIAHLGRPTAKEPTLSLKNVFEIIKSQLKIDLDIDAEFCDTIADCAKSTAKVIVIENIRFFPEEESKHGEARTKFSKELASLADIFVNDAFPDYRESVSTYYITRELKSYLGANYINEVKSLAKLNNPNRPFLAILGGAKLSEKLDTLSELIKIADKVIIGGAMAYTIMKAQGVNIGKSLYEADKLDVALKLINVYPDKLVLPIDHLVADEFSDIAAKNAVITESVAIPEGKVAIDIGPKTIQLFISIIHNAQTILLNGPLGVFEWKESAMGTIDVYQSAVANKRAYTIIGGGDSISAINKFGLTGFDHVSTGGGAMLAFLAEKKFPTLDVILDQF